MNGDLVQLSADTRDTLLRQGSIQLGFCHMLRPVRRHAAIKSARPALATPCWLDSDEFVLPSALTFRPVGFVISSESDPSNGAAKPAAGFACSSATGRNTFAAFPCSATLCLVRRGLRAAYLSSSA